jgi:AcrR family transcriptional regulator
MKTKMPVKKQGRRSAEDAEQTRLHILHVAKALFCELSYNGVSLRNISEKAGISHSLIRHHFGSKEQIWHCICDITDELINKYALIIIANLAPGLKTKERVYQFIARMLAFHLIHPQAIKLLSDVVREEGDRFDHFMDRMGTHQSEILAMVDEKNDLCLTNAEIAEIRWQVIMHAQSAASMLPLMRKIWAEKTSDHDHCLLMHWSMFNDLLCHKLSITDDEKLKPAALSDIVYEIDLNCIQSPSHL